MLSAGVNFLFFILLDSPQPGSKGYKFCCINFIVVLLLDLHLHHTASHPMSAAADPTALTENAHRC